MDDRITLINKISEMILKQETDFKVIKSLVEEYDILLEEVIRNFYELKQYDEIPLFELCEFIESGKENYMMSEEEFEDRVSELVESVNNMFEVEIKIK